MAYFEDSNDGKRTRCWPRATRALQRWSIEPYFPPLGHSKSKCSNHSNNCRSRSGDKWPKRAWRWWTPWPCARWRRSCCGARNRCRVPLSLAPLPATELQIPLEENSLDSNSPRCKLPTSICVHTRARAYMPVCKRINPTLLRVCLLHVCIFTHVHTYMHINTYTCTYIQMYIHAYAHTYTCATIYAHKP